MNYLIIDKSIIISNCKKIKNLVHKVKGKLFIMIKSNMYGFGYQLIDYIYNYVDGFVIKDVSSLQYLSKYENQKKIILLHCDIDSNKKNIYTTCCEDNREKSYIRVDPFLGIHGMSEEKFWEIRDLKKYTGVLIYINEFLNENELKNLLKILKRCVDNNLFFNIGGSSAIDYINYFNYYKIEYRLLRKILFSLHNSTINFQTSVLTDEIITKEKEFGFKSDRVKVKKGYVALLSFGYYDFKLLPLLYKKNIPLKILGEEYKILCYPCMNTMWIYSDSTKLLPKTIQLFSNVKDVKDICRILDIDIDEFYTSFSNEIERIYN